jgi:hypothetical protein
MMSEYIFNTVLSVLAYKVKFITEDTIERTSLFTKTWMLYCSGLLSCDHNDAESGTESKERVGILIKESSIKVIDSGRDSGKAQLIISNYN